MMKKYKMTGLSLAALAGICVLLNSGFVRSDSVREQSDLDTDNRESVSASVAAGLQCAYRIASRADIQSDETEEAEIRKAPGPDLNIEVDEAALIVTVDCPGKIETLGYADKETFLKDFGFEGREPFYRYVEETGGKLQMELYYDEHTGASCGIRYFPDCDRDAQGFVFQGADRLTYGTDEHLLRDRSIQSVYSKLTYDGYDASRDEYIENFEEKEEYTADGKMKHYLATGWCTYLKDEKDIDTIMEMSFTYREDGSLQSRYYGHNQAYGSTWCSTIYSYYDPLERLIYEDCYITHGSVDYYYIYEDNETEPSYYLVIDHNLGDLCGEMFSCHDIVEDEMGKCYGTAGPDLSDNVYVKTVRKVNSEKKYSSDTYSHTYCADYDGDGYREAFVIIGDYEDWLTGEYSEDMIFGSVWFVDNEGNATYLETTACRTYQEYIRQDGKIYLLFHCANGLPWKTDVYTVKENIPDNPQNYSALTSFQRLL